MSDKNPSQDRARLYQQAFNNVMGDPFAPDDASDETTTGPDLSGARRVILDYPAMKGASPLQAQRYNFGFGHATSNPLRPSISDYICDVERVVAQAFEGNKKRYQAFMDLFLFGDIKASPFSDKERGQLEQRIGRLFLFHGLSPISKYFKTVRRPSPEKDRAHRGK